MAQAQRGRAAQCRARAATLREQRSSSVRSGARKRREPRSGSAPARSARAGAPATGRRRGAAWRRRMRRGIWRLSRARHGAPRVALGHHERRARRSMPSVGVIHSRPSAACLLTTASSRDSGRPRRHRAHGAARSAAIGRTPVHRASTRSKSAAFSDAGNAEAAAGAGRLAWPIQAAEPRDAQTARRLRPLARRALMHGAAAARLHAHEEAMGAGAADLGGLVGAFHGDPLVDPRLPGMGAARGQIKARLCGCQVPCAQAIAFPDSGNPLLHQNLPYRSTTCTVKHGSASGYASTRDLWITGLAEPFWRLQSRPLQERICPQ